MGGFFDAWGPTMAYVLGYWLADGNMYSQPSCGGYTVSIGSKDRDHLEIIRAAIGLGRISPITGSEVYKLVICRKAMYESLARLGGSERKSLTLAWPHVPDEQLPHLARGYTDGDGCLTWHRSGRSVRPMLTITGTLAFVHGLSCAIEAMTGIPAPPAHPNSPGKAHIRVAKWYGVHAKCLAIWLYQRHSGIALERKAILAEEFACWEPKVFRKGRVTARMWELFGDHLP
jgi:hypothetical protein